ncbi:hypothetical protein [Haloarchaeobius sp. DFWS5]|uniref:hypothetical protein n=1 Tax=Haloarchaeobius sp. DFWS5 TaxID=3446114 RepID=UPI003EBEE941
MDEISIVGGRLWVDDGTLRVDNNKKAAAIENWTDSRQLGKLLVSVVMVCILLRISGFDRALGVNPALLTAGVFGLMFIFQLILAVYVELPDEIPVQKITEVRLSRNRIDRDEITLLHPEFRISKLTLHLEREHQDIEPIRDVFRDVEIDVVEE